MPKNIKICIFAKFPEIAARI